MSGHKSRFTLAGDYMPYRRRDNPAGSPVWRDMTPFRIWPHDNPESIRFRKYATGTPLVLEGRGVETGRTPRRCVWAEDRVRLYRYEPVAEDQFAVPVLLVYAHILRPYILDLVPERSFVEYLLGRGFDVYLLDWGVPAEEDVGLSFENYVLDYLPAAAERVLDVSRAGELTLLGHCMGGTISAMYAALFPERLRNLILLAAPVGRYDIICPPSQTRAATGLAGSRDREDLFLEAGHVGLLASPEAARYFWPRIAGWLESRSQPGDGDD